MTLSELTSGTKHPQTMKEVLKVRTKDLYPLIDLLNAVINGTNTGWYSVEYSGVVFSEV